MDSSEENRPKIDLDKEGTKIIHPEKMKNIGGKLAEENPHEVAASSQSKEIADPITFQDLELQGASDSEEGKRVRIVFSDDLLTGIEVIDLQHKEYFQKMNDLLDDCAEGMNPKLLQEAFKFLDFFMIHHFATEESLMKEFKYPAFKTHKDKHHEFRVEIHNLEKRFRLKGFSKELTMKLDYLLVKWFVDQVKHDDFQLSKFLQKKAATNRRLSARLKQLVKNLVRYGK